MYETTPPVIIVGAGLAGLVAAQTLAAEGRRSLVLDKASRAGGRLATRRFGGATFDTGAQFFTVRDADFALMVHEWRAVGLARQWSRGFREPFDGFPRYCIEGGMNNIAQFLAADLDVVNDVTVESVEPGRVTTADGAVYESDAIIVTAPVPQAVALLRHVDVPQTITSVTFAPCLAALLVLDRPSALREPGGLQLTPDDDPTFTFVADNALKEVSAIAALTLHANDAVSIERLDADPAETLAWLQLQAARYIGDATPVAAQLKRWRYARPFVGHVDPCAVVSADPLVVLAGDGFGPAKVEGAALSGLAAARLVLGRW